MLEIDFGDGLFELSIAKFLQRVVKLPPPRPIGLFRFPRETPALKCAEIPLTKLQE